MRSFIKAVHSNSEHMPTPLRRLPGQFARGDMGAEVFPNAQDDLVFDHRKPGNHFERPWRQVEVHGCVFNLQVCYEETTSFPFRMVAQNQSTRRAGGIPFFIIEPE